MKKTLVRLFALSLVLAVFVTGLTSGVLLDRFVMSASASSANADTTPNTNLILDAWRIIDLHYVDRDAVTQENLTYGAITGMVDALGDTGHTTFLTPQMLRQHQDYTRGTFEGIGAQVEKRGHYIIITAPMDDSPALKAGLKSGDAILRVDDEDMTGRSVEYVISKIIGPAGTQVNLVILDGADGLEKEFNLTRAVIRTSEVTWSQVPGTTIGVVRISGFSDGVSDRLKNALNEMKAQNITGVILDLRNNPGGLLHEAVTVASQFLGSGNVLLQKDANGSVQETKIEPGGVATDLPVSVLVNYGSASASEIVSGAIQDANRGKLVGETTFGTGTVLNTFSMSDGSALLLATQEWLTPNGRVIWHQGIKPDERVSLPARVSPLSPGQLKTMTAEQFKASQDTQLHKAVELLNQSSVNGK
jgi:carboxyl-terminal processing protease